MNIDPIFTYLSVLAVIQPARIQDIESYAEELLPVAHFEFMRDRNLFRRTHEEARMAGLVIPVRRGVYFTSPKARGIVRRRGLERGIDNNRLFLMKAQRKRYK